MGNKNRLKSYTFTLTADDNDFLRDYRFSEIMKTSNLNISFAEIITTITQKYLDSLSEDDNLLRSVKRQLSREEQFIYRFSIMIPETFFLELEQDRYTQALKSQSISRFSRGQYIHRILLFYKAYLESIGYELIPRPENIKEADKNKMLMANFR